LLAQLDEIWARLLPEATDPEEGARLLETLKDDLRKAKEAGK
jgi:hypothetical protein